MDVDAFGAVVIVVSVACAVISVVLFARASRLHALIAREGRWWLDHGEGPREAIREAVRQTQDDHEAGSQRRPASERRPGTSAPR